LGPSMKLSKLQLHTKILLGLLFGVILGLLAGRLGFADFVGTYVKPLGSVFIKLISMVVVPLVFASLLVGTASLNDVRKLGRIGGKTLAYYLCTTAIAVTIGLLLANALKPGVGLTDEARAKLMETGRDQADTKVAKAIERPSITDVLLNIVPTNPIRAFVEGRMLQIIFFALLTGICLTLIRPERSAPVVRFFQGVNDVMIQMVHIIMKIAPYGVLALIAAVVADFGAGILLLFLGHKDIQQTEGNSLLQGHPPGTVDCLQLRIQLGHPPGNDGVHREKSRSLTQDMQLRTAPGRNDKHGRNRALPGRLHRLPGPGLRHGPRHRRPAHHSPHRRAGVHRNGRNTGRRHHNTRNSIEEYRR